MAGASGAAALRAVTTGERMLDGRIEVLSGLRAGERVRLAAHVVETDEQAPGGTAPQ